MEIYLSEDMKKQLLISIVIYISKIFKAMIVIASSCVSTVRAQ